MSTSPMIKEKKTTPPGACAKGGAVSLGPKTIRATHVLFTVCNTLYKCVHRFWTPESSLRYTKAKNYTDVAKDAIKEMHRQVCAQLVC